MNLLFIAPLFFGYEKAIAADLKSRYHKVIFRSEVPFNSTVRFYALRRLFPKLANRVQNRYTRQLLQIIKNEKINRIFVIRGYGIREEFFSIVRTQYPQIEIINYQWDSIQNNSNGLMISKYAHKNYSFDLKDTENYPQFTHLPLFYNWNFSGKTSKEPQDFEKDIDVLFIGGYQERRNEIVKIVREACKNQGLQFVSNNIFEDLGSPDICLHLAWRDGFAHNSNNHILDLSAHYKFLTALIDGGLKHLAVMGTMHEVGYWEGKVDENTPCNPISLYGIAKDTLRKCLFQYNSSHNCTLQWLRGYYILGDDLKNHSIFCKLLQAANNEKKTFPFATGKIMCDFIFIDELTRQIVSIISQDEVSGIINCCSGHPVSLVEKVEEFIVENKLDIKLDYGAYPDRPYDSPIIYGDTRKIEQVLHDEGNGENQDV